MRLRQVHPSPFGSMEGSGSLLGSRLPVCASTKWVVTSPLVKPSPSKSKLAGHPPIGGPASGAGAATAAQAGTTAIIAARANAKSIRLIKHYLLVRATLGGLFLVYRLPSRRLIKDEAMVA